MARSPCSRSLQNSPCSLKQLSTSNTTMSFLRSRKLVGIWTKSDCSILSLRGHDPYYLLFLEFDRQLAQRGQPCSASLLRMRNALHVHALGVCTTASVFWKRLSTSKTTMIFLRSWKLIGISTSQKSKHGLEVHTSGVYKTASVF